MVTTNRAALRPLRVPRASSGGGDSGGVPELPERVPERAMAPDWSSPTEDNGVAVPRAELHIALIAPDRETAEFLKGRVRVVKPALWKGSVLLHVITEDRRSKYAGIDARFLQLVVDLGLMDSHDLEIGPPDDFTIGYPTGLKEGQR